ncbi:MAG TPA: prepilin-type N-terminal cleavage/methylation domain-containing protein [Candidatus Methylomirabilis sp.]|nr:prepilin-type N-terminal cleavage/methylation domain-containing protein [Candidatus Methylomirabilis sp.]
MAPRRPEAGMTLIEVMIAIAFMSIALLALLAMLASGYTAVAAGGSGSKATSFARQLMEQVRNQTVTPATSLTCPNSPNPDTPETGVTRTCAVSQVGATVTPNRLWRVTVTVSVNQEAGRWGAPGVVLESMRAECPASPSPC